MTVPKFREKQVFPLALLFGTFHVGMTAIGALVGYHFLAQLDLAARIISFVLLSFIGVRMIWETRRTEKEEGIKTLGLFRMLTLAVATSIDTLAAGITVGLSAAGLLFACLLIGAVAFAMTLGGAFLGERVGDKFQNQAGLLGGLVLIGLGIWSLFG